MACLAGKQQAWPRRGSISGQRSGEYGVHGNSGLGELQLMMLSNAFYVGLKRATVTGLFTHIIERSTNTLQLSL